MNLMAILFFSIIIVSCLPIKKFKSGLDAKTVGASNPLDLTTSVCLKGVFALVVVLHHFAVHYGSSDTWMLFQTVFSRAGAIAVGVFFMLSAFGLTMSYQKHGVKYLKKMLFIKLPKLYLLHVFINGFYILNAVLGGTSFNGWQVVIRLLGLDFLNNWERINGNAWFMTTIIAMYLIFIAVFACTHKAKYNKIIDVSVIMVISVVLFHVVRFFNPFGMPTIYVRAITCFPLGMAYAFYYKKINRFLKKYWHIPLVLSSLCIILDFAFNFLPEQICTLIACVFVIAFVSKVDISNFITYRVGQISLELYLIHGLFLILCNNWIGKSNQITFTTISMAMSIAAGVIIYWLQKAVSHLINLTKNLRQRI